MSNDSPAQLAYHAAVDDALAAAKQLKAEGREDRLAGLVTAVDVGTGAAFTFSVSDETYENATSLVRLATEPALRDDNERVEYDDRDHCDRGRDT